MHVLLDKMLCTLFIYDTVSIPFLLTDKLEVSTLLNVKRHIISVIYDVRALLYVL